MRPFIIILSVALALLPARAVAQPPAPTAPSADQFQLPDPGDILPLRRGTPAPQDGLLIAASDLLSIQQSYERMRFLLGLTQQRDAEVCDVRVQVEHAHTAAAEERLTLRDELWTARQTELTGAIAALQAQVQQAQHSAERQWYEAPALWFAVGIVVSAVAFVAVSVR
jgi:hypothetical protein